MTIMHNSVCLVMTSSLATKAGLLTGRVSMGCVPSRSMIKRDTIIGSVTTALVVLAVMLYLLATRWQRILAELSQLRMNRVKRG